MTTITAKSILASAHADDPKKRIDTLLLRYPRWIHAEFMTHRVFSRNAASSRAIPVEKLIQSVLDDPAVPLFWGKNQKGMQATEENSTPVAFDGGDGHMLECPNVEAWLHARDQAIHMVEGFAAAGYHKQIVNRLLEPFSHITVVVTGTQWSNFLALRDHPDAEPHIQMLAREVREALVRAQVQFLNPGDWHLPFVQSTDLDWDTQCTEGDTPKSWCVTPIEQQIKLSVARCASTSYKTVDGFDMTLERAVELHDKLVASTPLHASPCEHQAWMDHRVSHGFQYDTEMVSWKNAHLSGNLGGGFVQYRKTLSGECL